MTIKQFLQLYTHSLPRQMQRKNMFIVAGLTLAAAPAGFAIAAHNDNLNNTIPHIITTKLEQNSSKPIKTSPEPLYIPTPINNSASNRTANNSSSNQSETTITVNDNTITVPPNSTIDKTYVSDNGNSTNVHVNSSQSDNNSSTHVSLNSFSSNTSTGAHSE